MPIVAPTTAENVTLYGYVRDATGTAVQGISVLITPGDSVVSAHHSVPAAPNMGGEAYDISVIEVLTDADGLWQSEIRRGMRVTLQIPRLNLKVTHETPPTVAEGGAAHPLNVDSVLWAYQPDVADSKQFTADPTNAPAVITTTALIRVASEDLHDVLDLYDQIRVYRATSRKGAYAEVTVVGTRLELSDDVTLYEYTETIAPGQWYKADYYDSISLRSSPLSEPLRADAPDYAGVVTVQELKDNWLFGLDLTDDNGRPYPKEMFERYIRKGIDWFQREIDINLQTAARVERQDYYYRDFQAWGYAQLDHYPVLGIPVIEYMLAGATVFTVPDAWKLVDADRGVIQIVPTQGDLGAIFLGASAQYIGPLISQTDRYPGYLRFTYNHGWALGTIPTEFIDMVAMKASIGVLNIAGDLLVGAGIANVSVGVDGAHQSIGTTSSATNAGFGARIKEYEREIKENLPRIRSYYKGIIGMIA